MLSIEPAWEFLRAGYLTLYTTAGDRVQSVSLLGYEVIGTTGSACGPGQDVYRHKLLSGPDGSITDEQSELIKKTDVSCIVD